MIWDNVFEVILQLLIPHLDVGKRLFIIIKTFLMGIGSPWLFFISCKLYLLQPGECRITTWLCDMPAVVMSSIGRGYCWLPLSSWVCIL